MIIPSAGLTNTGKYYETAFATRHWCYIARIDRVLREYSIAEFARLTQGWQPQSVYATILVRVLVPLNEAGYISLSFDLINNTISAHVNPDQSSTHDFYLKGIHFSKADEYLKHGTTPELLAGLVQALDELKLAAKLLGRCKHDHSK